MTSIERMQAQLDLARAALAHLVRCDCIVVKVELGGREPLIEIGERPRRFIKGALAARITVGGIQRRTMLARVHGCSVTWIERVQLGAARAAP